MKKTLLNYLCLRQTQLEKEIGLLEKRLNNAPEGTLRIGNCRGKTQYFIKTKTENTYGKYLADSEIDVVKALAQKAYDKKELKIDGEEKKLLDALIDFLKKRKNIYSTLNPKRRVLITPCELPADEKVKLWLSEKYERKGFAEESQQYITERGDRVRSKSEKMIADMLYRAGVPYKYEKPYRMANKTIFRPDFTILNKRTGEEFILEHFGMMDDDRYRDVFFDKMTVYAYNDFIVGVNMFVSYEGSKPGHEFNGIFIKKLIKECFT